MQHSMLRPLALGSPTPSRTWLGYKQSTCRGLGTAPPLLSPACARGPARSLADPRGTRLPPWHRKKMSRRCLEEDDDDLAPRRGRNSDSISEKDSSRCRDVGADDLQHHPQCVAARDAVLEGAAPSRTLSPPHWRRAARPGLSLGDGPSLEDGPGAGLSYVVPRTPTNQHSGWNRIFKEAQACRGSHSRGSHVLAY